MGIYHYRTAGGNISANDPWPRVVFVAAVAALAIFVIFGKVSVTPHRAVELDIAAPTEHVPPKNGSDQIGSSH